MSRDELSPEAQRDDLFRALQFVEDCFTGWLNAGLVGAEVLEALRGEYQQWRQQWEQARAAGQPVPELAGLPRGRRQESVPFQSLRYWELVEQEIHRLYRQGRIPLVQWHALTAEVRERQAALERRLPPNERPPAVVLDAVVLDDQEPEGVHEVEVVEPVRRPRRSVLEMLLDPRAIQMLLALGGALMVLGLVLLLWINEFFTPPVVATGLGIANIAVLLGGWWVLQGTRFQMAGRALTLLACLVMPLNLWYYHATGLVTLEGHLWVAAVVISVLYAASAVALRDELFVYILSAGVTLTGLLFLASLSPSPQVLWELTWPATMLVVLGLLGIHVERAFPDQEGPFGRKRFGLAFFWSGHALLAAGLLLVLVAQVTGKWLYEPFFAGLYQHFGVSPSPLVHQFRWLALALILAGAYAYIYSDLVVRHVGVYVHIAGVTLMWAMLAILDVLDIQLTVDALIAVLALAGIAVNAAQATAFRQTPYTRSLPIVGLALPLLGTGLGLVLYLRNVSPDLKAVWQAEPPGWSFVGAMVLTALASRLGALVHRGGQPRVVAIYWFATAASTLVAATGLLVALGLETWMEHAPLLMLVPIAYLVAAARFYRGSTTEKPLLWTSHAAAAAMLLTSVASALEGFVLARQELLNLALAGFFAEAAVFYGLAAAAYRTQWMVELSAASACGALWQLLSFAGAPVDLYLGAFALVGAGLLVAYRFAVLEQVAATALAEPAFRGGNALLSLALVASLFLGLTRLGTQHLPWNTVVLSAFLALFSLLAVAMVRHMQWRRWYVVTAIAHGALAFLAVTIAVDLSLPQKVEIFCVALGLAMLVGGHIGQYREQDRESDLVSLALWLGSLLVGAPLAIATLIDRSRDQFILLNELGFFAAGVLLLATGIIFQLKATSITGAALTVLYFVALLIYVPWSHLNTVALLIALGGGTLFLTALLLSIYRDRLLALPEQIQRGEGIFRVLKWR